jgi:hypothetical protein
VPDGWSFPDVNGSRLKSRLNGEKWQLVIGSEGKSGYDIYFGMFYVLALK